VIMLSDADPDAGIAAPGAVATYSLNLYVPDVDATVAAAERAGATVVTPVAEQFYGSRTGTIVDPFGIRWLLATHVREVSETELAAVMKEYGEPG